MINWTLTMAMLGLLFVAVPVFATFAVSFEMCYIFFIIGGAMILGGSLASTLLLVIGWIFIIVGIFIHLGGG